MKNVRLEMGFLPNETVQENDNMIEKRALLVYCGDFESMDGPVKITEDHLAKLCSNHNGMLAKFKRMASGEGASLKVYPPVQLDHSTSAKDTVGRVVGDLEISDYNDEDGEIKKALFSNLRILGKENVEKVKDGRWTHLSIGADLEAGKLNELTITPFPAAKNAFMSKHRLNEEQQKHLEEKTMSYEKQKNYGNVRKMQKHLMDNEKLSEEDVEKKLSEMPEDEVKKMADSIHVDIVEGEHTDNEVEVEPKLSAEDEEKKKELEKEKEDEEKKLSLFKKEFTKLSSGFRSSQSSVRLEAKKSKIMARLSSLKAQAKITPAEIKKIDVAKLAGENEATINAVLDSFKNREPVILTGIFGTTKAEDIVKLSKKKLKQDLEREARKNMKSLSSVGEPLPKEDEVVEPNLKSVTIEDKASLESAFEEMKKLISEGKDEEAKKLLEEKLTKTMAADEVSPQLEKQVDEMNKAVMSLNSQFESMIKLVDEKLT